MMKPTTLVIKIFATISFLLLCSSVAFGDSAQLDDIDVGFTEEGHPYKGNPDAPLILVEYSDFLCPFCARYFNTTMPELVEKYIKTGQMRMEFRHFPIQSLHPTAATGHEAAACASEQGAVTFWQFHSALFGRQNEWSGIPDPDEFLAGVAKDLGLNMQKYDACRSEGRHKKTIVDAMALAAELEFNGTPTFQMKSAAKPEEAHTIVGAHATAYFSDYADALIAGKEPPKAPEKPKPELPVWAKSDAIAADPNRPGFTVSGDPYLGDLDARLVMVEFTDYQCPACARHETDAQPAIVEQLIATGKLRWITKVLPLQEHRNAPAAAAAAECAADQNRFWDMHHALFEKQDSWAALKSPDLELIKIATELNLDADDFSACLGSRQALERVLQDMYDAATVTRSTPTFVLLDGETGNTMRGARDADNFIGVVQKHLDKVLADDKKKSDDENT